MLIPRMGSRLNRAFMPAGQGLTNPFQDHFALQQQLSAALVACLDVCDDNACLLRMHCFCAFMNVVARSAGAWPECEENYFTCLHANQLLLCCVTFFFVVVRIIHKHIKAQVFLFSLHQ